MPPAISDDEQSDLGDGIAIPLKEKRAKSRSAEYRSDALEDKSDQEETPGIKGDVDGHLAKPITNNNDDKDEDDEDDEDDDLEPDEYIVEKILDHQVADDGTVNFRVKWEGYERKSDQTWEPEDSLKDGASEVLAEYLQKLGGREALFEETSKAKLSKKRGRASGTSSTPPNSKKSKRNGHPSQSSPPASAEGARSKAWTLPSGSWEDEVESIDACEDEESGSLIIYLNWRNGQKTKHSKEVVYKRCPQKMLQFYERHIRIIKAGPDTTDV